MKSAFLVSKGLLCLHDKQNNTWLLVDMEFLFSCSTRYLTCSLRSLVSYRVKHSKRNSTSTRAHVLFSLYIISSVMRAFWSVLTYDLLEDRRIDDVIIKTFFNSLLYKTNRFKVAVRLFSNRSQRTSNCGKNIIDTLGCTSCATFFVLTTFWRHLWSITEQTHGNNLESIC